MKTNSNTGNDNRNTTSAKVEVIKLGQDLHAANVMVTVYLDGCPPQPPQRIAIEKYWAWLEQLKAKYAGAKIYSCYEAGPCGYWLHRGLVERGVENYVVAPVALNGRRKNDQRDSRALGRSAGPVCARASPRLQSGRGPNGRAGKGPRPRA